MTLKVKGRLDWGGACKNILGHVQVRSEMASVHVLRLPCVVRGYHSITGCLRGALVYGASLPRPPHWSLHGLLPWLPLLKRSSEALAYANALEIAGEGS